MASCNMMLIVLLTSSFPSWGFSSSRDYNRTFEGLVRGIPTHHSHNLTSLNVNNFWSHAFSHLMNSLMNELKPDASTVPTAEKSDSLDSQAGHTETSAAPVTSSTTTTTAAPTSSNWEDWDLDDFHACRGAVDSMIRRLANSRH